MTCQPIGPERWSLSFSEAEGLFIVSVLAMLGRQYQEDVSKLPPTLRAYWQGRISSKKISGDDDMKESQEVLAEARMELRSERLALAENWLSEYELAEDRDPWVVEITSAERDEFVAMLNDRRLLLALESGITDGEMETHPDQITDETRRNVVFEIDVLGHFILVTLGPQMHRP